MLINCMKCKKKQDVANVEYEVVQGTGAFRAKGLCPVCHGKVGVFVGEDKLPSGDKAKLKPISDKIKAEKKARSAKAGGAQKKKKVVKK